MSGHTQNVIAFIKQDVEAAKPTSRGRIGVVLAYLLVPAWVLWKQGVHEAFDPEFNPPNMIHYGASIAFVTLGVAFFLSLGKARFIKNGFWAVLISVAVMLGFSYVGQMALWDFEWAAPQPEDWAYAWSCASIGLSTGLSSAVLMLSSLFVFGPFPTRFHQIATAFVSASLGLLVLTLYCPLGDVFHMTVGHLGQFAALFVVTFLAARLLCRFALARKLGSASKSIRGLGHLDL